MEPCTHTETEIVHFRRVAATWEFAWELKRHTLRLCKRVVETTIRALNPAPDGATNSEGTPSRSLLVTFRILRLPIDALGFSYGEGMPIILLTDPDITFCTMLIRKNEARGGARITITNSRSDSEWRLLRIEKGWRYWIRDVKRCFRSGVPAIPWDRVLEIVEVLSQKRQGCPCVACCEIYPSESWPRPLKIYRRERPREYFLD